jgi:hypothetical protein
MNGRAARIFMRGGTIDRLRTTAAFSTIACLLFSCTTANTSGTAEDGGADPLGASSDLANGPDQAGPCPAVLGSYSVTPSGQGCGDLNASAPQCIQATNMTCVAHFVSAPPGGTGAINGAASLKQDGSFDSAALLFGTVQRTGCTGTWNAATSTMTVDCGGMGSSQSCVVTLVRTSMTCP